MKIGLIDNDLVARKNHSFPNLAVMKISGYHKKRGDSVDLIGFNEINPHALFANNFDLIYVSKAFTSSETPDYVFKLDNVKKGGGLDFILIRLNHCLMFWDCQIRIYLKYLIGLEK